MEIQEQQFVRELAESRMQIELLRNRVLLRYYAQLLELDIMEQTQEVKALMSSINTLERYARKYEPKEPTVEPVPVENGSNCCHFFSGRGRRRESIGKSSFFRLCHKSGMV